VPSNLGPASDSGVRTARWNFQRVGNCDVFRRRGRAWLSRPTAAQTIVIESRASAVFGSITRGVLDCQRTRRPRSSAGRLPNRSERLRKGDWLRRSQFINPRTVAGKRAEKVFSRATLADRGQLAAWCAPGCDHTSPPRRRLPLDVDTVQIRAPVAIAQPHNGHRCLRIPKITKQSHFEFG